MAGLVLGVIGTALIDLTSRKVSNPGRSSTAIGVPLLGEVRDP